MKRRAALGSVFLFGIQVFVVTQWCSTASVANGLVGDVPDVVYPFDKDDSPFDSDDSDDDVVQRNPNYERPEADETTNRPDNEDLEEEHIPDKDPSSNEGSAALKPATNGRNRELVIVRFLNKHRIAIILAFAMYTFRKDILKAANRLVKIAKNLERQKIRRQPFSTNATNLMKVLVIVTLLKRLYSGSGLGFIAPLILLLLVLGSAYWMKDPNILILVLQIFMRSGESVYLPPVHQHYTFELMNERYKKDTVALERSLSSKYFMFADPSYQARIIKKRKSSSYNKTIILLELTGLDVYLRQLDHLRDAVTFLIRENQAARTKDKKSDACSAQGDDAAFEILVVLGSSGGGVSEYALAAQQLLRMRDEGIQVTVCVDKVAASGGYMIACASSPGCLFAAPFALLGSIGVIGERLNANKALEGWGVKPLVFRGGKDKAPLTLFGEVTQEGIEKTQEMIDAIHSGFKHHVSESRPILADRIEEIATGNVWIGYDALSLGLVDRIVTSDAYIGERIADGARVLRMSRLVRGSGSRSNPTSPLMEMPRSLNVRSAMSFVTKAVGSAMSSSISLPLMLSSDTDRVSCPTP